MKKLTLFSLIISLLAAAPFATAQDRNLDSKDMDEWARGAQVVPTKSSRDVEGNPFYNDEWQTGHVFLQSGNKSKPINLKYNAYTNELIFRKDGKLMAVRPSDTSGFVLLDGSTQTVFKNGFKSPENKISPDQFLRVVYNGEIKLLVKHNTRQHERRDVFSGNQVIKYIPKNDYYLVTAGGIFHDIKLKKKDVTKTLKPGKNKLEQYAESHDLDFGEENDLKQILAYYENTLRAADKEK